MIFCRSPLRITLGGGGTDLPAYASKYGGFCISAAIDKYAYVGVHKTFQGGILLKYSEIEKVSDPENIKHPIMREALSEFPWCQDIEVTSIADVPANGSGLGGSSAFTVALLNSLHQYNNEVLDKHTLAEEACDININKLEKAQGCQDEYISSLGGIQTLYFSENNKVTSIPLYLSPETLTLLEENLMLFYTGIAHDSNKILREQENKTQENNQEMIDNLHHLKEIGHATRIALQKNNIKEFIALINEQYENKRARTPKNDLLDEVHYESLKNGALASKIVGSGDGGFMLCYAKNREKLRFFMKNFNFLQMKCNFDFEGTKRLI